MRQLLPLLALSLLHGQDTFTGVSRIVAIGDLHGDLPQFRAILRAAGLTGENGRWTGGATHLVQTGDAIDRGPDSRAVLDLLMKLQNEAKKAGGRVHALLGNHEAMNIYGDLRYVTPAEFLSYRTNPNTPEEDGQPPGYAAHRRAFGPEGAYGRWLRKNPAAVMIDTTVFLHGGIGPAYARTPLREINRRIRDELRGLTKIETAADPEGPLWYRGLAAAEESALATHLDDVLARLGATRMVIGHTPTTGTLVTRFGGRVVLIDAGISKAYNHRAVCLEITGGRLFAVTPEGRTPLDAPRP